MQEAAKPSFMAVLLCRVGATEHVLHGPILGDGSFVPMWLMLANDLCSFRNAPGTGTSIYLMSPSLGRINPWYLLTLHMTIWT